MDRIEFTIDGRNYRLSRDQVLRAMRQQSPGRIQTYAAEVDGRRFPVKQVLAQTLQIPATKFVSTRAQAILQKLEFPVINVELERDGGSGVDQRQIAEPERALALAVQLLARQPDLEIDKVLQAAASFEGWLRRPRRS